ncbi:protein Wnt-8a-like [Pholidichthys leucotaenia]
MQATREASFAHAITAAGVMHTLTKNCSVGDFDHCGCDDSRLGQPGGAGWVWGGCSDNVDFGHMISRQFVDALEDGHDTRAAVNLHNNEAGRLAIRSTLRRACKCHGVSGSCVVQTCWMQLADFREVGNYLKTKYRHAKKLEMNKKSTKVGNSADNRALLFTGIATTELVYLEDSPNYCMENHSLGLYGTKGRECLRGQQSLSRLQGSSCHTLCHECGLRVAQRRQQVSGSCNCKFHWCCSVKCDQCTEVVKKFYCVRREGGRARSKGMRQRGARPQ